VSHTEYILGFLGPGIKLGGLGHDAIALQNIRRYEVRNGSNFVM